MMRKVVLLDLLYPVTIIVCVGERGFWEEVIAELA